MALITPPRGRFAVTYWLLDQVLWDKASNTTSAWLHGYPSRDDRDANFPASVSQERIEVTGMVWSLPDLYQAAQGLPAWSDGSSDE